MLDAQVDAVLAAYPALHAAWRRRAVREEASGRRLSNHLAGILDHLDGAEPVTAGDLAQRLGVTPATVSIQLNRLVRLRLVTRQRDESDGRRVLLRLTEGGARLRSRRSLLDPDRVRAALERLDGPEREAAITGLRALVRAAQDLPEIPASKSRTLRKPRRPSA